MEIINSIEKLRGTLSSQGLDNDDYNAYEDYHNRYGIKPSFIGVNDFENNINSIIDFEFLIENIKKDFNLKYLYKKLNYNFKNIEFSRKVIEIEEKYVLDLKLDTSQQLYSDEELFKMEMDKNKILISDCEVLIPVDYDKKIINKLCDVFTKSKIKNDINRTTIEMVSMANGNFYTEDFYLKDNFLKWNYPEYHYGKGFNDFHEKLMEKIYNNFKGLVVLHGDPGSGKTQYIRKIIQELTGKARVLYFSPLMIDSITNPEFINFIQVWARETDDENKKRIIILEDAEPLLETRKNGRNLGITNLLNLTSGLLSDVLSIQYICTFNTKIDEIDQALLREERLTAIKKFNCLNYEQTIKLTELLKIKKEDVDKLIEEKKKKDSKKEGLSLAEIYSIKDNNEILEHNVNLNKNKKIGFYK